VAAGSGEGDGDGEEEAFHDHVCTIGAGCVRFEPFLPLLV